MPEIKMKVMYIFLFLLIIITLILLGYLTLSLTGRIVYDRISVNVTRVIDGDTLDSDIGRVRLLGINTPEKKQPYHEEARDFLKQYEGKIVELEVGEKDKYGRTLAYVFYGRMINSEILNTGLATLYVYEKDSHYSKLKNAEKYARESGVGLWKKSENYGCIEIVKFEPIDNEYENETLILANACNFAIDLIIKDDANHIYSREIKASSDLQMIFKDIFNDGGDSLYIRDGSGLLLFYRY